MKLYKQHILLAYENIQKIIEQEMCPTGLLHDVQTLLTTSIIEDHIETPLIWMEKGTITPGEKLGDFGLQQALQVPISFICCGEEEESIEIAEQESYSIALRLVSSILRNFTEIRPYTDYELSFTDVQLVNIEPNGNFEIINKRIIIPATRVEFMFEVYVDWMIAEQFDTKTMDTHNVDLDNFNEPQITVNPVHTDLGCSTTLQALVQTTYGQNIDEGCVTFYIEEENMTRTQIGTATVDDGVASTEWTVPGDTTPGSHTLYAVYEQNNTYKSGTGYNTFQIRIPTTTTVSDVLASIGETATFTAQVKYNTNQNVNEGTVQFQLGGSNIGTPVNVSNGLATLQYEIPSNTPDGANITAVFIETNTYGASTSSNGTLDIRDVTNVSVSNLSANRSSTASIVATITDANNDPITTGQAKLYIDNTQQGEAVNVANDGTCTFSYNIANNAVLGGHTIKVVYQQNSTYETGEGTATLTIRTPTVLTGVNVSANQEDTVPITVRVTDTNNVAITSGTVNITVGNSEAVSATVSNQGEATINYEVPANQAHGTINFTAAYVENNNYESSTMSSPGVLTIREGTSIVVDSLRAEIGDTVTLGATITDESSEYVDTGSVNFEID